MNGTVALLGVFFVPGAVIVLLLLFQHRNYCRRQETIRAAIEKGADPSFIATLDPPTDRRLPGLVWLLAGLAIIPGLWAVAGWKIALFGLVPAAIGLAYVIAWRLGEGPEAGTAAPPGRHGM